MKQVLRKEYHESLEPYVDNLDCVFYNDVMINFNVVIKSTDTIVAKVENGKYFIAENLQQLMKQA